jgi:hypothetical protein
VEPHKIAEVCAPRYFVGFYSALRCKYQLISINQDRKSLL